MQRIAYALLVIFTVASVSNTNAQLKVASFEQGQNRFGNISIALDPSGQYIGGIPSNCNERNININNSNDTVIVRAGTTITRSNFDNTINGVVIVYGTIDLESGNHSLNINSNGQLLFYAEVIGGNNTSINVNGYMLIAENADVSTGNGPHEDFIINGSGVSEINGDLTTPKLTNNGSIIGIGTIYGEIDNQGTINGSASAVSTTITPLGQTPQTALTWTTGPQWNSSPPGQGNNDKEGLAVLIDEDFEVGVNPGDFNRRFSKVTVRNSKSFKINGDFFYTNNIVLNNGNLKLRCSSRINPNTNIVGNGSSGISMSKCLDWTGWHYFNFPVKTNASLTLDDIVLDGTPDFVYDATSNARNIYQWDPDASTASTLVGGKTFIYWGSNNGNITLNASPSDFNNASLDAPIAYHNPGAATTPPGGSNGWASTVTDGWVMIPNPFQDDLDWDNVRTALICDGNFDETAVYIWDGHTETYVSWNGSGSQNRFVPPYTPVFVRTSSSATGNFTVENNFRRANPIANPSARMANELSSVFLSVQGQGYNVQTEIVENSSATDDFDGHYDAHYMLPMSSAPLLFSVTDDSLAASINQRPNLEDTVIVSFAHASDGALFTLSLSNITFPSFVNIMLYDIYEDTLVDINQSAYEFVNHTNAPVERFRLVVRKNGLNADDHQRLNQSSKPEIRAWFSNDDLNLDVSNTMYNAQIHLVDMAGQTLISRSFSELNNISIPIDLPSGVYVVWVYSPEGSQRTKIVKH